MIFLCENKCFFRLSSDKLVKNIAEVIFLKKAFFETSASEYLLIFTSGGTVYFCIEILWRGYSHWSMALLGGICYTLIYAFCKRFPGLPPLPSCIASGTLITICELAAGEIVNRGLGWEIWDYSRIPLNFDGQICALYSLFWCLLSYPVIYLAKFFRKKVFGYTE